MHQLTTTKAVSLLNMFSQLTGYPQAVDLNGKTQIVTVPYDLGPKAQWNAVKNRAKLRPTKDMADELIAEKRKRLQAFLGRIAPNTPIDVREKDFADEQAKIDEEQKQLFDHVHEIDGLLKIPAKEIRIRRTDTVIQNVLEALLSEGFLDGEPDVGDAPAK